MNLYIESLEGGTYLVALDDGQSRTYLRDNHHRPRSFQCLSEIKRHLAGKQFDKVWLKQNTPYDEMCGLDSVPQALEMELDWH